MSLKHLLFILTSLSTLVVVLGATVQDVLNDLDTVKAQIHTVDQMGDGFFGSLTPGGLLRATVSRVVSFHTSLQ